MDNGRLRQRVWTKEMDKADGQRQSKRQMDERNGHSPAYSFTSQSIATKLGRINAWGQACDLPFEEFL